MEEGKIVLQEWRHGTHHCVQRGLSATKSVHEVETVQNSLLEIPY